MYYYGSILCTPIIMGSYSCTQDGAEDKCVDPAVDDDYTIIN